MTPLQIEQRIFELEDVRVVVRAPSSTNLGDYAFQKKADKSASVSEWITTRVRPAIGDCEIVVIDGSGAIPHGRTKMSTLRASYIQD